MTKKISNFVKTYIVLPLQSFYAFCTSWKIFLLLLIIVILQSAIISRDSETNLTRQKSVELANKTVLEYSKAVNQTKNLLILLSSLPDIGSPDNNLCHQLFATTLNNFPQYSNVVRINQNGDVTCTGISTRATINVSDRQYFIRALKEKKFVVGGYIISRSNNTQLASFAYPVYKPSGELDFILAMGIKLDYLQKDLAESISLPAGYKLTIIDQNALMLYDSSSQNKSMDIQPGKQYPENLVLNRVLNGDASGSFKNNTGSNEVFGYSTLGQTGGFVIISSTASSSLDTAWRLIKNYYLVIFLYLIVIGFVLWLLKWFKEKKYHHFRKRG